VGKTLGRILLVGAAIAINVIPGVGQAITGAVYGTLAGGAVGSFAAAALTLGQVLSATLTLGLTAAGLQAAGGLLGLGPSAPKPDTTVTAIKTAIPPRVSAYGISRLYGAYVLYETASDGTAVDVYAIVDGELTEVLQYYLADDKAIMTGNIVNAGADGRYRDSKVSIYSTTGAATETAIAAVTAKIPAWDSYHRGDGVVLLAVLCAPIKSKYFLECYPNGVPTASMAAKWQKCPDAYATDPSDSSAWTWTENPIRQLMHYKLVREGVDYATKIAPAIAYWKAAQDVCDEAVALKAGGTEDRYRSWVSHKHTDSHASVVSAILATCDGWIAPREDGALVVYAGKYVAPTVSIGSDEIVSYEWHGVGVDDDQAVNELVCSYISSTHDYNTVETDAWRDEADISTRGAVLSDTLEPQTPSWGQVRRIAKRAMSRRNAPYRGTVTTNIAGRTVRSERYINLTIIEAGTTFFDGVAEIVAVTRNMATGGVTFDWVAADPNIDTWNPATEEGNAAPLGDRVALAPLDTPAVSSASAVLSDDGNSVQIDIIVDAPDRADLTWFARWKVSTDAVWNEAQYSDIDPGASIELLTGVVPANASIDIEVAYQVGDGRVSDWSSTSTVDTTTAGLAPSANTDFTATGGVGEITGSWRNATSSNFDHSRYYRGATSVFASATAILGPIYNAAGSTETFTDTVSAGTYYVWTRSFNAADVGGTPTGPITVTVT